jgi:hypothetical protein
MNHDESEDPVHEAAKQRRKRVRKAEISRQREAKSPAS